MQFTNLSIQGKRNRISQQHLLKPEARRGFSFLEMGQGISTPNYRYKYVARSADEFNELFQSLMHKGNVGISADKKMNYRRGQC
jgi:hypothetical protein